LAQASVQDCGTLSFHSCRSMYFLWGLLVHALVALAARRERSSGCALNDNVCHDLSHQGKSNEFVFVHWADPQLGMLNQFSADPKNITQERTMASMLVQMAINLDPKPAFFLVGGDMQNQWPHEPAKSNLGTEQREAITLMLNQVKGAGIPIICTPGNHDVDDEPNSKWLTDYKDWWKDVCYPETKTLESWVAEDLVGTSEDQDQQHRQLVTVEKWKMDSPTKGGFLFLQINSQIYWTKEKMNVADLQTEWIKNSVSELDGVDHIVVLTHIPPFMNKPNEEDENHGWANWQVAHRLAVMSILEKTGKSVIWLCGHFHTNVENVVTNKTAIIVTSSAGTPMWWAEALEHRGWLTPEEAGKVAQKDVGQAFCEDIRGKQWEAPAPPVLARCCTDLQANLGCEAFDVASDPAAYQTRKIPGLDRSGMRVFSSSQGLQGKWATVAQLEKLVKDEKLKVEDVMNIVD